LDSSNNPIDSSGNVIDCIVEAGLIAQEVLEIPNLSFSVVDPVNENSPYGIRYNNILTYSVAALKELDQLLTNNKNQLNSKSKKITSLETKVKNLEKQLNDEKSKVKTLQFQMSDVLNRLQNLESNKS
jgi:septal ring factor EnvC (AmiA/AmiB activator)